MNWSGNEVAALATKAALGAGAPPAQAAQFGRAAARHLAQHGAAGAAALTSALEAVPEGPILSLPVMISRLIEAAAEGEVTATLDALEDRALVESYLAAIPYAATTRASAGQLQVTFDLAQPAARHAPARIELTPPFVALLRRLAERTMVPESDASRRGGAGAGLQDNDE